ncbi:MAG: hypothetical protein WA783_13700 [Phormidesmis sp.]
MKKRFLLTAVLIGIVGTSVISWQALIARSPRPVAIMHQPTTTPETSD